ncbi:hypothetical protein [Sphingomonas sp. 10B4]|uniref:hypothetical protein n=1 Tax=Sphingomonas sp. 10B4 TaxID=3048575 RepID=UPI002AB42D56|nr:hypothetical protein [Sphingomonas sp. 10B4]MDY7522759.1 hypothetical protein [Sphingomonas sp. 10B4]MEB0282650.1 hypothetical protein [Sphingomonas sp. 10B4]
MSRGPDAATLLRRALERHADAAGCDVSVCVQDSTRWASATFAGARHTVALTLHDDPTGGLWLEALAEADLPIRGHLVADIVILSATRHDEKLVVALEALTVEV